MEQQERRYTSRRQTARSVIVWDRIAGLGIRTGGGVIILAVLGILAFILAEAWPLFVAARSTEISRGGGDGEPVLALTVDEYRGRGLAIGRRPSAVLFDPSSGERVESIDLEGLPEGGIASAGRCRSGAGLIFGTQDGRVQVLDVQFGASFDRSGERATTVLTRLGPLEELDPSGAAIERIVWTVSDNRRITAAAAGGRLLLRIEEVRESLAGGSPDAATLLERAEALPSAPTALVLASSGKDLFVGMQDGGVERWTIDDDSPRLEETFQVVETPSAAVTALCLPLGERTLIVGGEDGSVSGWSQVRDAAAPRASRYQRIHTFESHRSPIVAISASDRSRTFATAGEDGIVRLSFLTTERALLEIDAGGPVRSLAFAPKGDGILIGREDGVILHRGLSIPHPEISVKALFGKLWYEGYDRPEFVWQSSGGTDDFEGKFSLVPLLFGTIKGTLYALLFAVPIALLAAVYTSQFLHHRIRNILKPSVEIMAALPSVVLGLVAGLFLAPVLETIVPGTLLAFALLPILFLASAIAWRSAPSRITGRFPVGTEAILLLPIALGGIWLAQQLGPALEGAFLGGDFRAWLHESAGIRYDQRNCLVVGFAMGFAVIPIIFTICEDSLSAVPPHLINGSIACGASRWQTALRIVLPAAGSGIFSAIMVGFGRAIGETMIVLMATGNTPVLDWSPFNGMRTLSANIAVEIPEAPYRGTLYRILFLSGLLLFLMTFMVNTAAEVIRLRLRKKFGNY